MRGQIKKFYIPQYGNDLDFGYIVFKKKSDAENVIKEGKISFKVLCNIPFNKKKFNNS